ncbi:hypothetical protein D3C81_1226370 [compost metagenome]
MLDRRTVQSAHRLRFGQALPGVQAENPARRKQLADRHVLLIRFRPAASLDVPGQPLGQVVGVVRVDTHPRRVAVERMAQFHRAVGFAPPQLGPGLDHQHPAPARQAHQLRRQHRATEAATDNQDVGVIGQGLAHRTLPVQITTLRTNRAATAPSLR